MIYQLIVANGEKPRRSNCFPIYESPDRYKSSIAAAVRGVAPPAVKVIDQLKPYKGGNDTFWQLHGIDIVDKHHVLLPVVGAITNRAIVVDVPGRHMERPFPGDIAEQRVWPVKDGAQLIVLATSVPVPHMRVNVTAKFYVAFGEPEVVAGEPLVPKLGELSEFTEGVVQQFTRWLA
ncbi:MAG: hypothetical protein HYX89_01360 [Chloroflexi bacterium]|nr:hypothetical protein [Chloroflexota bacterium]